MLKTNSLSNYRLLEVIGQGSFGKVYRSINTAGEVFAIKIIDIEKDNLQDVLSEIDFLRSLRHKNILDLVAVHCIDESVWLCTEFCGGGSLHRLLRHNTVFKEQHALYIINQTLQALDFMHAQKIIHRDLKPANILLDGHGNIKLGDFGVSARLTNTSPERGTMIGTPFWMAPEVILQDYYGAPADMWAVGIMAIELVSGRTPYTGMQPPKAMYQIANEDPPKLERVVKGQPKPLTLNYISIVTNTLIRNPSARETASQLLKCRFIARYSAPDREFRNMVTTLMNSRPQRRTKVELPARPFRACGNWDFDEHTSPLNGAVAAASPLIPVPPPRPESQPPFKQSVPGSPKKPSSQYLCYIDTSLSLLENRCLRPESKIRIGKLRMQLIQLEITLNGFGKAVVEEIFYFIEEQEHLTDLMVKAIAKVEARSIKRPVKEKIRVLGLNFEQLEHDFPGANKALSEELRGRFLHCPYSP